MYYRICRQRIKHRKRYNGKLVYLASARAVQIKAEVESGNTRFEQEDEKQRVKYPFLRKKRDKKCKRTRNIVCEYPHELAAHVAAEGINKRHFAVYCISQRLIEINILTVEVKHEHRAVAERVYLHCKVDKVVEGYRQQESVYEIECRSFLYAVDKLSEAGSKSVFLCLGNFRGAAVQGFCRCAGIDFVHIRFLHPFGLFCHQTAHFHLLRVTPG